MLQACVNGGRTRAEHERTPLTAEEIAADLAECYAAGAAEAHFHPRDVLGAETLGAADIAAASNAARALGRPFGVSTQGGIATKIGLAAEIAAWTDRPDYASVNLSEPGAPAIRAALADKGVDVEAGVWSVADVARLSDGPGPIRILIEVLIDDADAALKEAEAILSALDKEDAATPRLLHGEGRSAWPLLRRAQALGYDCRIGLEDVLTDEAGAPARSNAAMVREALA